MLTLSIIIPIFNTREYLKTCIESICALQRQDIEVILVDDGSTDGVQYDFAMYQSVCNFQLKYYYQQNAGLSNARNQGLKLATGKYIFFHDSDDYLLPLGFNDLIDILQHTTPDIVSGNVMLYNSMGESSLWATPINNIIDSYGIVDASQYCYLLLKSSGYVPMVFNYLYRADFLKKNNLTFYDGILHEDELWTPKALALASSIAVSSARHYAYSYRYGSIMTSAKNSERIKSLSIIIDELKEFYSVNGHLSLSVLEFISAQITRIENVCRLLTNLPYE